MGALASDKGNRPVSALSPILNSVRLVSCPRTSGRRPDSPLAFRSRPETLPSRTGRDAVPSVQILVAEPAVRVRPVGTTGDFVQGCQCTLVDLVAEQDIHREIATTASLDVLQPFSEFGGCRQAYAFSSSAAQRYQPVQLEKTLRYGPGQRVSGQCETRQVDEVAEFRRYAARQEIASNGQAVPAP